MKELKFRDLKAEEIDCRVSTITENYLTLLLYKDARVDMDILDETVGANNWQRHHTRENANCIVSIWDEDKKQWIDKEDTGTESFAEAAKGLASDSFKRSCVNWRNTEGNSIQLHLYIYQLKIQTQVENIGN